MRIFGPGVFVATIVFAFASGCATGGAADDDGTDSGILGGKDSGTKDSGGPKDSGGSNDSGGPKDSGLVQDTGGGNCGGQCLGNLSTCCSNTCVDITSDPNNCGGCNSPCGSESCCSGNCVDTMGNDPNNCGGCGTICTGTCTNGQCQTGGGSCTLDEGTCSHSPCATGGALADGCDPEFVTVYVCDVDGLTSCCSTTWDQFCVDDAAFWENNGCVGGGC